jgi:hypothetical protein
MSLILVKHKLKFLLKTTHHKIWHCTAKKKKLIIVYQVLSKMLFIITGIYA